MSERWSQYFEDAGSFETRWLASAIEHWLFSSRLRRMLVELMPPKGRVLEIGCGTGFTGHLLASMGYAFTGVDSAPRLVERAIELGRQMGTNARFVTGDAQGLSVFHGQFDLAFSSGVLEHFERAQTVALLREQSKCARVVVIAIPTRWTRYTGRITDERFYSMRQLRAIVKDAGMVPMRSIGYGDITATFSHRALFGIMPRGLHLITQNLGYAYGIAVAGRSPLFETSLTAATVQTRE